MTATDQLDACSHCGSLRPSSHLTIRDGYLSWRCKDCDHHTHALLPAIPRKKVVHLDTSAALNFYESFRAERDDHWSRLWWQLAKGVREQVLVCPASPTVLTELEFGENVGSVVDVFSPLTGGVEFRFIGEIRVREHCLAFAAWLDDVADPQHHRTIDLGVDGRLDHWTPVHWNGPISWFPGRSEVERRRRIKSRHRAGLEELRARRAAEGDVSFGDLLAEERGDLGPLIWREHETQVGLMNGRAASLGPPISTDTLHPIVEPLLQVAENHELADVGEALKAVREYLHSERFAAVPPEDLQAHFAEFVVLERKSAAVTLGSQPLAEARFGGRREAQ